MCILFNNDLIQSLEIFLSRNILDIMFPFTWFQPMIAFVAPPLPYIPLPKGVQPKQAFRGEKNHAITDDVPFLHFTMKKLQEARLLPSLVPVSFTE